MRRTPILTALASALLTLTAPAGRAADDAKPIWKEYEMAGDGGWRTQGFHGPAHEFTVKKTAVKHPISEGLPAEFRHVTDELYSASMRKKGGVVLATAYCDPDKPAGTGMD